MLDKILELESIVSVKEQLSLVEQIASEDFTGQKALLNLLIDRCITQKLEPSSLDGILFEVLYNSNLDQIRQSLRIYFEDGIVELKFKSFLKIDYKPLQKLLISKHYRQADRLTQIYLCQLAGLDEDSKRNWLYFTDIQSLPSEDLATIDMLWRLYSRNKFGFSRQRKIWLSNNCNWEKLWSRIGWKNEGVACRYPDEFMWSIDAPQGHLPLFNQLRGVQVLSALFDHTVWNS